MASCAGGHPCMTYGILTHCNAPVARMTRSHFQGMAQATVSYMLNTSGNGWIDKGKNLGAGVGAYGV